MGAAPAARNSTRATPSAAARPDPDRLDATARSGFTTVNTQGRNLGIPAEQQIAIDVSRPAEDENKPARSISERLARLAAARLHPSRAPFLDAADHFEAIDTARKQRFSLFDPGAWSRGVQAHGRETALLAAALALLRTNDGHGRPIRSAASYLGGMLRQLPGALNPIASLAPLLADSSAAQSC